MKNHQILSAIVNLFVAPFLAVKALIVAIVAAIKNSRAKKKAKKDPAKKKKVLRRLVTCVVLFFAVVGIINLASPLFKRPAAAYESDTSDSVHYLNDWGSLSNPDTNVPLPSNTSSDSSHEEESENSKTYSNDYIVTDVLTGSTFVMVYGGEAITCRINCVSAPDALCVEEAEASRLYLSNLILGKKIDATTDVVLYDDEGVLYLNIKLNSEEIQRNLLFAGMVRIDYTCPNSRRLSVYETIEERVSKLGTGLWAGGWPVPPTETTSAE